MDTQAIIKSCLDDRKVSLEQLQGKYKQLNFDAEKAFFEESMYLKLGERHSSKYRQTFLNKQQLCKEKVAMCEQEKEPIEKEIKVLEKEIEYLEELMN